LYIILYHSVIILISSRYNLFGNADLCAIVRREHFYKPSTLNIFMKEAIIFIISLLIPMIYWRSLSYFFRDFTKEPLLRTKTKLQIHHLHHGIILVFIASLILLFSGRNIYVIILLGLGLGLMLDLFIPSLLMKSDRKQELKVYRKTFFKTLILFVILILIIILLSILFS